MLLDSDAHSRAVAALPETLIERARVGFAAFEALPSPLPKDEDWRYVDIPFDIADLSLATSPGLSPRPGDTAASALVASLGGARIVDGSTVEASGGDRVSVTAFGDTPPDALAGFEFRAPTDRIGAMHDAFAHDGVVVHARAGAVSEAPVLVEMIATADGAVSLPSLLVRADEQSDLSVLIDQRSADGLACIVVPRIEVMAAAAARVRITVLQSWGDATVAIASHRMRVGRDASAEFAEAGFGGAFSRVGLDISLTGSGAWSGVWGAYFGDREQTLDYRYYMRHEAPNTTSEMFLKGAVGDSATSVFTGMIRIEPEGQKTNAHQTNRNLVLSQGAEAHSVPNLEILADDVRCGHGSAVGPLDEEQRYYLMSRGLPQTRADRVQVKGFFDEALARFPVQDVVASLGELALAKYGRVVA